MLPEQLHVPDRLRREACRADAQAWLDSIPALVAAASRRWQLSLGPPVEPGGFWAWVAPGQNAAGDSVMLKLSLPGRASGEKLALATWQGDGAAALRGADGDAVLLLERLLPGSPLKAAATADQPAIAADVCARLWLPDTGLPLPSIDDRLAAWRNELVWLPADVEQLAREAARAPVRLLHGDLHEENLLADDDHYRAIDPEPLYGDPAFELEPLLRRHLDADDPVGARALLAACAPLGADPARALRWAAVRAQVYEAFCVHVGDTIRVETWQLRRARLRQLAGI